MALVNYIPETGVGRFNAKVVGNEFRVKVKFYVVNNSQKPLLDGDFENFKDRFLELVKEHWEGKYGFHRGSQTVRPVFDFEFIDDDSLADTAHFVIDLKNSNIASENVSRNAPVRFKQLQDTGLYFPAAASFFASSINTSGSSILIKNDLPKMFPMYIDTNAGALSRQSSTMVTNVGRQIAHLHSNIGISVTAYGHAKGNAQTAVVNLLQNAGLTKISTRMSKKCLQPKHWGKDSASKWSGHTDYVKVALKSTMDDGLFAQSNLFTYPAAVVHEFGHMLGLQDEYACLAQAAAQKMVELNFIETTEMNTYLDNHAKMSRVDGEEAQRGQKRFIKMCNQAGVEPPHFGRYTANIMSAGNIYEPCHFVTLRAALCVETGRDDWKIVSI